VNQSALFLLVISLSGIFIVQPLMREMKVSEPVIKLILAIVAGIGIALAGYTNVVLPQFVLVLAYILVPLFTFAPMILNALVRSTNHAAAKTMLNLIYWSSPGRSDMGRFLAKSALHRGDAAGGLEFLDSGDPQVIRAYALQHDWQQVLATPTPSEPSVDFYGTRIEALIATGQLREAEHEFTLLKQIWEKNQTPEAFRTLTLSETRLEAERGDVESVQKKVQTSLSGLPTYMLFVLLARAAETSNRLDAAKNLYSQAYTIAPEQQRTNYTEKLRAFGQPLPEVIKPKTPYGTYGLLATIIIAFIAQRWLEKNFDQSTPREIAAFLLNIPGVSDSSAKWRFLSYAFIHGGFVHIAFNAWSLFDLGRLYESRRNWGNLLASFIFGAVMGAYFTLMVQGQQQIVLVGASGGICGIAGSLLADSWRGRSMQDRNLTRALLQWIVYISVFGLLIPNVSFWGHTGGIIGGLLWGFIRQGLPTSKRIDWLAGGLSIGLIVYTLASVIDLFLRNK
jgi:rhomboid protease GluP